MPAKDRPNEKQQTCQSLVENEMMCSAITMLREAEEGCALCLLMDEQTWQLGVNLRASHRDARHTRDMSSHGASLACDYLKATYCTPKNFFRSAMLTTSP